MIAPLGGNSRSVRQVERRRWDTVVASSEAGQ